MGHLVVVFVPLSSSFDALESAASSSSSSFPPLLTTLIFAAKGRVVLLPRRRRGSVASCDFKKNKRRRRVPSLFSPPFFLLPSSFSSFQLACHFQATETLELRIWLAGWISTYVHARHTRGGLRSESPKKRLKAS